MNAAYVSALAALAGSAIGAVASLATTWLTQRFQDRMQRRTQELGRREKLYGDFIDESSKTYAEALISHLDQPSSLILLYSIKNKLRLFASEDIIASADRVMDKIVSTYLEVDTEFKVKQISAAKDFDILLDFTQTCREDLRR